MSAVELFDRCRRSGDLGIRHAASLALDWPAVIARKRSLVERWSRGKEASLREAGIEVINGPASFLSPEEIVAGERRVRAAKFVIATGSRPARPRAIDGLEHAMTSDELLDHPEIPGRLVIIGGGVIGLELGFCLARAGSRVTVLQDGPEILGDADEEMREVLLDVGRSLGMTFRTGVRVTRVRPDKAVEAAREGGAAIYPADAVLVAAGRPPNTSRLNLEAAGVECTARGGVRVNEYLQSVTAARVYAAGDAAGGPQHTPTAWYEGRIAARNALRGNAEKTDYSVLPTTVFTIPALARVGLTEQEARGRGLRVKVNRTRVRDNPAAGVRGEEEGITKLIFEEGSEKILGVHMLGPRAEDLIGAAAVALKGGLRRNELAAIHPVFPTLGSALIDAANGW